MFIIIITLFKSQIILAEHKCSTNWGDCKSNKSNHINQIKCWILRRGENRSTRRIYMPVGSCICGTISKYENGMPKVARNAFNIREAWNSVCCHGNKTVKLKLWSTISRILLQKNQTFPIKS